MELVKYANISLPASDFSPFVQTGSRARTAVYSLDTKAFFPRDKAAGA